ncbi:MAG TPA: hypothetical protein VFV37_10530 [Luteibaculaceae bacterium]|nr:hypothetical protein [Luteibaculaceae bacterium]
MTLKNALRVEWIKIQNRRALIFIGIALLINVALSFSVFGILNIPPDSPSFFTLNQEMMDSLNPLGFLLSQFSGSLALISSLFFIQQYGEEFKTGLIRKVIIDGHSRNQIFVGKMLFLFGTYLIWTLVLLLIFTAVGAYRLGSDFNLLLGSMQWEEVLKFYLHLILYGSFSFFIVTLTRSANFSTLFLLGLSTIVENLGGLALSYFEMGYLVKYLPFTLAGLVRSVDELPLELVVTYMLYCLSFIGIGHWVLNKRDM